MTRFLTHLTIILIIGWMVGFVSFVQSVTSYQEPPINAEMKSTDAAIVLTGGSERMMAGLRLLQEGKAKKLFISGVNPSVKASSLFSHTAIPQDLETCCIELGRAAVNTVGNAVEARDYMDRENFKSLRLVTANYHMPRSLLLLRSQMPEISIIPHPVLPDTVILKKWWSSPGTASLLASEYCKYLFELFRSA